MALLALLFLCLFSSPVFGALPVPAAVDPVSNQIGVAAVVKGDVTLQSSSQTAGHIVSTGEPVRLGDQISTGPEGNLQILLLDETVFTIGPNSSMVIDRFVYDPATDKGEIKAKILKGIFRFVSGKIARKKPSDMSVELPSGVIGIRGTMVMGEAGQKSSTAVLLGPGQKNNAGMRIGSFILKGTEGKQTEVTRPGFGASINEQGLPGPAFQVPAESIARMNQALAPPQNSGNASGSGEGTGTARGGNSPTQMAGQDRAAASGSLNETGRVVNLFQETGRESDRAAQSGVTQSQRNQDRISTFNDLTSIQTGKFRWTQNGIPLMSNNTQVGSYNIVFDIDFGARTIAGSPSTISGNIDNGANAFGFALPSRSFGSGNQNAVFQFDNLVASTGSCGANCTANATFTLNNQDGVIAGAVAHNVTVNYAGTTTVTGNGSGKATSRQPV